MSYWLKIIAPYDGSDYAKKAINDSIRLAEKFNSRVTVLNICWEQSDDESRALLRKTEDLLKKSGIKYTLRSVRAENPAKKILEIIEDEGFECAVIGAKGIGGAKTLFLGSVSNKIATEAKCTVMISR